MVSVIIPFYNAKHFLERSITSVINQTYTDIEIILINDGSTDGSDLIAKKYCNQHHNIKLFTSKNLGPGNARNIGINQASGEFIVYLDSDDTFNVDAIEILLDKINKDQSDIVICKFTLYDKNEKGFKVAGWKLFSERIDGDIAVKEMYSGGIASVVWGKMYRKQIIDKVLFPVDLWFEDRPYLMECFLNTDKISFVDASLLKIYSSKDSITRRIVTKKRIIDLHLIYEIEMKMLERYHRIYELSKHIVNHHVDVLFDTFFLIIIDEKEMKYSNDQKKLYVKYIKEFMKHYPKYPHKITAKRKVVLLFINMLRIFPWKWITFLGCSIFSKKYRGVSLLKNS